MGSSLGNLGGGDHSFIESYLLLRSFDLNFEISPSSWIKTSGLGSMLVSLISSLEPFPTKSQILPLIWISWVLLRSWYSLGNFYKIEFCLLKICLREG